MLDLTVIPVEREFAPDPRNALTMLDLVIALGSITRFSRNAYRSCVSSRSAP